MKTKTMKNWAHDAICAIDACNASGVLYSFAEFMKWLCETNPQLDTDARNHHPVVVLYTQALSNIVSDGQAKWPTRQFHDAYKWCRRESEKCE